MSSRISPLWAQALMGVLLISGLFFGTVGCDVTHPLGNSPTSRPEPPLPVGPKGPITPPIKPPGYVSVVPYTRIVCQPDATSTARNLETLLSQADSATQPASLVIKDEQGQDVQFIERLQIITGNETSFNFVFSQIRNDQVDIFLGKMDLLYKKAQFKKLGSAPLIKAASGRLFEPQGIASYVSFSRTNESLLVPDLNNDRYIIRDSFGPHILSNVFLSPKEYFNPVLSAEADMALFQKLEEGNLRNFAYSLISGEAVPFPKSKETLVQYTPHIFRTGQMAWMEKTKTALQLKLASWNDLQKKSVLTLHDIDQKNLVALDFGSRQGWLYMAQAIELYSSKGEGKKLEHGSLEIHEWNLNNLEDQIAYSVDYPPEFYLRSLDSNESLVERIIFSPWTNQWVASTTRGLATFSQLLKSWNFIGPQDGPSHCFNPTIGPEYHVEEVNE